MNRIICQSSWSSKNCSSSSSSRISSSNFSIVQRMLLLQQGVITTTWHQQQQPSCNLVCLQQQEQKKSSIIPILFVANSHSKLIIQQQQQQLSYYRQQQQQQQQQRNQSALRQQGQHASSNNSSLLSSYYRSSFSPVLLSSHYLSYFSTSTTSDDNNNNDDDDDVKGNMDVKGDKSNNMDDVDMEFDTTAAADEETSSSSNNSIRLSKLLSTYLGSISRRQVERTIKSGQVTMAGKIIKSPHLLVSQEQLQEWSSSSSPGVVMFKFGNQPIQLTPEFVDSLFDTNNTTATKNNNANTKVWLVHKLKGELVSESDPEKDRPCLIPRLIRSGVGRSKKKGRDNHLKPIGRLDYMTEGLILVTNCGNYAREMELPTNQLHRTYRVRIHGSLTQAKIQAIQRGITIDGIRYEPMKVRILKTPQNNSSSSTTTKINAWIEITCTQGKNRQVRNVLSHLGLTVYRLIRVSFGDYQLQTIPPGMAIPVPMKRIETQIRKGPLFNFSKAKKQQASKDNNEYPQQQQQTVQWVKYYN